jgi:hypothetical protein
VLGHQVKDLQVELLVKVAVVLLQDGVEVEAEHLKLDLPLLQVLEELVVMV